MDVLPAVRLVTLLDKQTKLEMRTCVTYNPQYTNGTCSHQQSLCRAQCQRNEVTKIHDGSNKYCWQ